MDVCKEIRGIVYTEQGISGRVSHDGNLQGIITMDGTIGGIVGYRQCVEHPKYQGEYEVTPRSFAQVLDTDNKLMEDDVNVKAIPYYETSNTYGETVYIGTL